MTEPKKDVEGKQAGNPPSGANKPTAGSPQNKKPAARQSQAKSPAPKSPAKAAPSAPKERSATADSAKLKDNAARAEALEHRDILRPEEKETSSTATEPTDVTGVIVPSEMEEMKPTEPVRGALPDENEKSEHSKSDGKHKKKDKAKQLKTGDAAKGEIHEADKPIKDKDSLLKKTAKAEKKVHKLKKKVHKAEKKEVKKSKLRLLKEKLTKAFSKWQRRKKKLDETDK